MTVGMKNRKTLGIERFIMIGKAQKASLGRTAGGRMWLCGASVTGR